LSAATAQNSGNARLKEALLESLAVSRGGVRVRAAVLAVSTLPVMAVLGLPQLLVWLGALIFWDAVLVRPLERHWVLPVVDADLRLARLRRASMVLFGFTLTQGLPLVAWSTGGAFGAVVGAAWVMCAATQLFIYYSRDRLLLAAGMVPIVACILIGPALGFGGLGWESAVISMFMLVALAAGGAFVGRSDALIAKAAEEAAARRSAEAASTAKSRFIANMHHELRTPLNAIIGYTEMMREDAAAQRREADVADLDRVLAAARLQLMMMSDLLAFSALQDDRAEIEVLEFDARALAQEAAEALRAGVESNGNALRLDLADLGRARTDPEKLRHCLEHLITNAGKFTHDGVITLRARRECDGDADWLAFAVMDTGVGIAPERQARIFEPFTQGDESDTRGFGGAGIGLAITARLARLIGGGVSVESAPGRGSTFTLRVRADLRQAPPAAMRASA
jgi:signal transduction histidine kinase